jgi:hypothetical protein
MAQTSSGHSYLLVRRCPLRVQPVWKRFSYPNEYKQPGVKDLDATI